MAGNTFGTQFTVTTFGESHGAAVGCVIDGCPPGIDLDWDAIQAELARRRPGQSKLVTPRDEKDQLECLSGLDQDSGKTLGTPIAIMVRNQDQRSKSYEDWHHIYRPSHADFGYDAKYGIRAWQGGGRSSARETIGRVAAGAVAGQVLAARFPALRVTAWVERVHNLDARYAIDPTTVTRDSVDASPTRCPDPGFAADMETAILEAKKNGDSLGGYVRCVATGLPPGLGAPLFAKLDAIIAQALMSLPAAKGVEIGSGFSGPEFTGLEHNDPYAWADNTMTTSSNRSGGIQGGISNGMPIDCRVVFKPTATVLKRQDSADDAGNNVELQAKGRHDPCVLPRAVPIVEAMINLCLVDAFLQQRGQVGDPWPGLAGPLHGEG
ncbi:MAG: chorismate synthase [Planctomycetota bacterium]|jgi:chorismate synthase|nr:chorismate synthase [Planctomycetota bacterium]